MLRELVITECPRDGIQGLPVFIPTQTKADYINVLLKVGFDIIDFGSFVSPKAIPQLRDTAEVLNKLDLSDTRTELMAIVANQKGAETAASFEEIGYLAFPFSISPAFLKLNINASIDQCLKIMDHCQNLCDKKNKKVKVYLTMAFGNPYGDKSNPDIVYHWSEEMHKRGISYVTLSDITGVSDKDLIKTIYDGIIPDFSSIEFGFHLHTTADSWYDKVDAAWQSGCRSFDAVINGMGGCPMTNYELVGNLNTINLLEYFDKQKAVTKIDKTAFNFAINENQRLIIPFTITK
jgi:hydroxymethylglutaryl-CoA lyase